MNEDELTAEQLLAEATRLAGLAAARARQLTRDDLAGMTPDEIVTARAQGRLDSLLAGKADA